MPTAVAPLLHGLAARLQSFLECCPRGLLFTAPVLFMLHVSTSVFQSAFLIIVSSKSHLRHDVGHNGLYRPTGIQLHSRATTQGQVSNLGIRGTRFPRNPFLGDVDNSKTVSSPSIYSPLTKGTIIRSVILSLVSFRPS